MISVVLSIVTGIIFGVFTGLLPGIHTNLICTLILSMSALLLNITSPMLLSIFIISMSIANAFFNAIPSIYLGAPESDTALNVLPGHKLLLKGKGHEAVLLTIIGSLAALILALSITPLAIILVKYVYPVIKNYIAYILIVSVVFIIVKDKSKFWSFFIFLLAGVFGLVVFKARMEDPLFPMLSGLFGTSSLVTSLFQKTFLPKQIISFPVIEKIKAYKSIVISLFSGALVSFLPGLGPAQAAIIGSTMTKEIETKNFLIMVGGINMVNFVLSFVSLYVLDKARNGSIVAISEVLESFSLSNLILFIGVTLIAGGVSTILAINTSKIFSKLITKVNYTVLCILVICFIGTLVMVLTGFLGLFILSIGTAIGIIPIVKNTGRNHLMGCLILPVILYFLL